MKAKPVPYKPRLVATAALSIYENGRVEFLRTGAFRDLELFRQAMACIQKRQIRKFVDKTRPSRAKGGAS